MVLCATSLTVSTYQGGRGIFTSSSSVGALFFVLPAKIYITCYGGHVFDNMPRPTCGTIGNHCVPSAPCTSCNQYNCAYVLSMNVYTHRSRFNIM